MSEKKNWNKINPKKVTDKIGNTAVLMLTRYFNDINDMKTEKKN